MNASNVTHDRDCKVILTWECLQKFSTVFFYRFLLLAWNFHSKMKQWNEKRKLERSKICEHFNCGDNIISGKNYLFYDKHLPTQNKLKIIGFLFEIKAKQKLVQFSSI